MSETETETKGRHAAPDDDPSSDPQATAGDGGDHAAEGSESREDSESRDDSKSSDDEEGHGTRYPGADPEDEEEIEEERERRLDPDNRPENAEVDNTDRDFDAKKGRFTDSDDYDQAEEKFPDIGEQGA